MDKEKTTIICREEIRKEKIKLDITDVANALREKGYNPVAQLSGYMISGDPAYITNHKNARAKISQIKPQDIIEVLLEDFLKEMAKRK